MYRQLRRAAFDRGRRPDTDHPRRARHPAEAGLVAAGIRAHEAGFCAASNCVHRHLGVASPLGGMVDRAANRVHYVATLIEDLAPGGAAYRAEVVPSATAVALLARERLLLLPVAATGRCPRSSRATWSPG